MNSRNILIPCLLLSIALLFLSDCRQTNTGPDGGPTTTLHGNWEWIQSEGGFAGVTLKPPPSKMVIFEENGTVSFYENGILKTSTTFTIQHEKPYPYSHELIEVIRYGNSSIHQTYTIAHDTLFLDDLCIDCFRNAYKKGMIR